MLFFFHCNPRWVYGVFRDFFLGGSIRVFFLFLFVLLLCLIARRLLCILHFLPYPQALDHSQLRLRFRHNIAFDTELLELPHGLCHDFWAVGFFLSLRFFLKIVLYICSFTLLRSGRRYGFTFSGYVFHVTPVWFNWLLRAVYNLKFTSSRLPLLWSHVYETRCNFSIWLLSQSIWWSLHVA